MYWTVFLATVITAVNGVYGFDCSSKELQAYNLNAIKGVLSADVVRNTPPSTATTKWYVGVCQNLDSEPACSKNLDVCGITTVDTGDAKFISEKIEVSSNIEKTYTPFDNEDVEGLKGKKSGIAVAYKGVNWGDSIVDAEIQFVCGAANEKEFSVAGWDGKKFVGRVVTDGACAKGVKPPKKPSGNDGKGNSPQDDRGESWGWFTWIFIFMVLFLSIYIIGGAWFQYNKGNAIDFSSALKEVLENFVDLLRGLPVFIKEIIEKITGNPSRGEYSAV